jgi:hypothetical protein
MPDPQEILVWVVAVPAAISLLATLLAHLPPRRDRATQPWGPALALAGAFAAAFAGLRGPPAFPPRDAQTWLVYLAAISVLIAILATILAPRKTWPWFLLAPLSIILILVTVWLLARSQIPLFGWKRFLLRAAVIAAGMIVWWLLMEGLAARPKGMAAALPLVLTVTASVASVAIVNAHSVFLGQLAGSIAAALGAITLLGLWFKKLSLSRGGLLTLTIVLLGVILAGHFFADLSRLDLVLLGLAPLAAWAGELPWKGKRARFAVRVIAVLIVLLIPLVPALKGLRATLQEQTDSYMY